MLAPRIVDLAAVDAGFRAISEQARKLVSTLGVERLTERPAPNRWSVAECLVHLNIAAEAYLPVWREALHEARDRGWTGTGPFKLDLWGRVFVWVLEPPPKFRFPAPRAFQPVAVPSGEEVLPVFLNCQEQVLHSIAQSDGLGIDRIKIRSPFDRRFRYSVWSSFCANLAHHRRHLWQAGRVADDLLR